jgi:hypothetical protein
MYSLVLSCVGPADPWALGGFPVGRCVVATPVYRTPLCLALHPDPLFLRPYLQV